MSNKQPRGSLSPSSTHHASKLPKFLQKQTRDRSKSMLDPSGSASSSSSSSSPLSDVPKTRPVVRKTSKRLLAGGKEKDDKRGQDTDSPERDVQQEDNPIIVEPVNIPRPRTRSERPVSENYPATTFYPSHSNARISDLPTRLSGWFSHTFSTSSADLSLPNLISQQHLASTATSPKGKGSALLTATKHGKGHLDKAMRYLLDSDAMPDKCPDSIWLLGVEHPGYEAPLVVASSSSSISPAARRGSVDSRSPSSIRSSTSSSPTSRATVPADPSLSQSQPPSSPNPKDPSRHWPPVFYSDFTSRIWVTYRSQFQPIRDTTLSALEVEAGENTVASSPQSKRWHWLGGEKGWTSDAGWGCMLRTGQSLLANALLHLHLGRDWRRPPYPVYTADYATYVQIITWFLDNPSPLCPFSVHRMALVGKELGKDVGQWFGPSTAAGAIKSLVHAFPEAALGVAIAADGVIYQTDVFAASHGVIGSPRRQARSTWGSRGVLVLIGIRLGIDGVNPIYYDTIKTLYTFPQSVGIAGGRPSSSYYFVGSQADNLFYLDPHHARPTIPLRPPPRASDTPPPQDRWERQVSPDRSDKERDRERFYRVPQHARAPTSPASLRSSTGSGSSVFSHRGPITPSPLQQQISTSTTTSQSSSSQSHVRWQSSIGMPGDSEMDSRELGFGADLDESQRHYVTAYSAAELKTFHCERVRKMPLSGLDPSMLIGFLCKDENDWIDLRHRVADLSRNKKTIFTVQDEPPTWPSDSDDNMGLESISEPDIDMPDDEESLDGRSQSASPDTSLQGGGGRSEVDTEEDPIGPITPSAAKTSFDIGSPAKEDSSVDGLEFDDEEDEEEWVDPMSSPIEEAPPQPPPPPAKVQAPTMMPSRPTSSTSVTEVGASSKQRKKSKRSSPALKTPVPSSQQQYPFPASVPDEDLAQPDSAGRSSKRMPQMRTAKARDGGRTQSGGVRGVPTDDMDDF